MSSSATDGGAAGGGLVAVTMPQMGVSVAEGTVVEWRKRPGDWVEADETVCEISSDKIDSEVPAPASGRLAEILVEVDETVPVGTELARIDTSARPGEPHVDEAGGGEKPVVVEGGARSAAGADRSRFYSPVVQRMAAEHGVDLSAVGGTGVGGRVTKKDLLAHIKAAAESPLHTESPYRPEEAQPPVAAGERRRPMSPIRKRIARHMLESRRTAAHCTTVVEVDMSRVVEERRRTAPALAERGVPLTYLAFVARAAVAALQEHPVLNASVEGEEIVYHGDVNLGIAVALEPKAPAGEGPAEGGLIVPVIHRAQRLSLEGIAAAIAELSERARSAKLTHADVEGGTFTITNPGRFGAILATPIINQPQVAILDLEAVVKRPVVVEGPAGEAIAIRPMANLCLSWDHRALDGAQAARFLAGLKARLEDWSE